MSKLFFGGRSSPNQTCTNLLVRDTLVGDESHAKNVDNRRAVVAGVGGGDGQQGGGEDECLHGGGLRLGLGTAENM